CDDCQLVCPWNKFAAHQIDQDFSARAQFKSRSLLELLSWTEAEFLTNTEGSPIRRTGFEGWRRNIAVALGNAPYDENIVNALKSVRPDASDLVQEHIDWALTRLMQKQAGFKS
ncbi:MAG: tRNA epoxyqueuosine(34) reductase QueG, partial [Pseudomonadales bacterium]